MATSEQAVERQRGAVLIVSGDPDDRDLAAVDVAGHPEAGARSHQRGQDRIPGQMRVHGDRIGIGVEQCPHP